jgi:aspartokinase-like uncharacterized kinase
VLDAVVKVGGSLARGAALPALGERLSALGRQRRVVVVPGGGVFADAVREYDALHGLSAGAAHWMAVLAMDQYGYGLTDLIAGSTPVRSLSAARDVTRRGSVAVLLPHDLLRRTDPLPHTWSVTSDTIAAWVAARVGVRALVLLKDGHGISRPLDGAVPPPSITLAELARWDGVDAGLHEAVASLAADVWIVNGERPELLEQVLLHGRTEGVRLRRSPR